MPVRMIQIYGFKFEGERNRNSFQSSVMQFLMNMDIYCIPTFQSDMPDDSRPKLEAGKCIFRSKLPRRILNEGAYRIELAIGLQHRRLD